MENQDLIVMCAAVADYKPEHADMEKVSKQNKTRAISLIPTQDILFEMGRRKTKKQLLVGFALETTNELEHAKEKLQRKNLDMIVLNSLNDEGAGFGHDTNKISIIDSKHNIKEFPLKQKSEVAKDIVEEIIKKIIRK
jgi:phosphopantothenoylcysteine decarboxylase/phosphopantothenate--cysteine ligase